jgi:hypothetical protein
MRNYENFLSNIILRNEIIYLDYELLLIIGININYVI